MDPLCGTAIRSKLLNKKDVISDDYLRQIFEETLNSLPEHLSESEKMSQVLKIMIQKLHCVGTSLAVKLSSVVKTMVEYRLSLAVEAEFVSVSIPEISVAEKSAIYGRMFTKFID